MMRFFVVLIGVYVRSPIAFSTSLSSEMLVCRRSRVSIDRARTEGKAGGGSVVDQTTTFGLILSSLSSR